MQFETIFAPLQNEKRFHSFLEQTEVSANVIFVNENKNENGEKRENNEFVNEN